MKRTRQPAAGGHTGQLEKRKKEEIALLLSELGINDAVVERALRLMRHECLQRLCAAENRTDVVEQVRSSWDPPGALLRLVLQYDPSARRSSPGGARARGGSERPWRAEWRGGEQGRPRVADGETGVSAASSRVRQLEEKKKET